MKGFIKSKKGLVLLATLVVAAAAAVGAYAYWTQTGGGTGSASVTNPGGATSSNAVSITNSAVTGLYPGGSQTVSSTISNPNPWRVKVDKVDVALSIDSGHALCSASDFTYTGADAGSTAGNDAFNGFIAASPGTGSFSGTLAMADTSANQDACKGATVTLTYTTDNAAG